MQALEVRQQEFTFIEEMTLFSSLFKQEIVNFERIRPINKQDVIDITRYIIRLSDNGIHRLVIFRMHKNEEMINILLNHYNNDVLDLAFRLNNVAMIEFNQE